MRYLLDTCVLSELVKPGPAPGVMTWMAGRKADELCVSAMTLGELQRGVAKLPLSRRRNELQLWLQQVEDGRLIASVAARRLLAAMGLDAAAQGAA